MTCLVYVARQNESILTLLTYNSARWANTQCTASYGESMAMHEAAFRLYMCTNKKLLPYLVCARWTKPSQSTIQVISCFSALENLNIIIANSIQSTLRMHCRHLAWAMMYRRNRDISWWLVFIFDSHIFVGFCSYLFLLFFYHRFCAFISCNIRK